MRRASLLIGLATVVLLAAPGVSLATTQTASSGNVDATFSFRGSGIKYTQLRLKIVHAGQALYNAPVRSRFCAQPYCGPLEPGAQQSSVHVLNLEPGGQPDVVIDLFSGGAHCCEVEQVYSLDPGTMTYVKTEHNFGNAGDTIKDLGRNGQFEFVGADDAFFYAFASYAASGAPVQIWSFRSRRFVKVTRRYPSEITHDAARWWRAFAHHYRAGEGLIAPWAADEELLGHGALVKRRLGTELRQNHLHSDLPGVPTGQKFVVALQKFLRKVGYIR